MSLVNVHNEWDIIEEIIVGTAKYASFPKSDRGFELSLRNTKLGNITISQFNQIIEETEEDIANIVENLKKIGIRVRRPEPIKFDNKIRTLDWESEHYFCYCPRDILLAIGDMIIETPSVFRSRYFESYSYKKILLDYMRSGSRWISAPKPRLQDEGYNFDPSQIMLKNVEPVFDAANVIRAGRDLFYLVSDSGNELGCEWLQSVLGEKYRVHACRNLYKHMHIDTTISLLRPGLLLVNPQDVTAKEKLPKPLQKWDMLICPEMIEVNYSNLQPVTSEFLGMNLLMLSPDLAMVDENQVHLIKLLEKNKINVMPSLLRHGRILGGGAHCITLDVRRKGQLEDYFS